MRPGREADYEAWLARLVEATRSMPGFLGVRLIRPRPADGPTYTSVFRFASVDTLWAFEQSELRSIGQLVALTFENAPAQLRLLLTIILEVALMTWVIMPRLTRWLARWIHPRSTSSGRPVE